MNLSISKIGKKIILFTSAFSLGCLAGGLILLATSVSDARSALQDTLPYSAPIAGDDFQKFLEGLTAVNNIFQLDAQGLAQGKVSHEPWAGSYWPIHQGVLGNRYANLAFPKAKDFTVNYNHFVSNPPINLVASGQVNELSPSEKYDLLIGDANWTFTKANWQAGLNDMADGGVASWTGICHGWSGANDVGITEPQHSVKVMDVTGTHLIEFYAHDIKGLESYLWASPGVASIQAGERCRQPVVVRDPYLRPTDPNCLDSNPMTWHLAIVNRVGVYKKTFVMDSSVGPEVWNYPIASYDYNYFNPRSFESSHSLRAAIEPIENLTADRYKATRDPRTHFVVGITMDVFHPALISPRIADSNGENVIHTERYTYDLELDENYAIIGGEWYSKEHPDFLWTFPAGSIATTREDVSLTESWDVKSPLPQSYAHGAVQAAQRGKVLSKIISTLLSESLAPPAAARPDLQ